MGLNWEKRVVGTSTVNTFGEQYDSWDHFPAWTALVKLTLIETVSYGHELLHGHRGSVNIYVLKS